MGYRPEWYLQLPEMSLKDSGSPFSSSFSLSHRPDCLRDGLNCRSHLDHKGQVHVEDGKSFKIEGAGSLVVAEQPHGPWTVREINFKLFNLQLFGGFCLSQQNYTFSILALHNFFLGSGQGKSITLHIYNVHFPLGPNAATLLLGHQYSPHHCFKGDQNSRQGFCTLYVVRPRLMDTEVINEVVKNILGF